MTRPARLFRDERGASAAEFTLVLPLFMILLFGTIDVGRYAWSLSEAEKATQTGARWAVATDMVASGLYSYSFATSGGVPQGTTVNATQFPGVVCQSNGTTATCACATGGTCNFPLTASNTAFTNLVTRMTQIYPDLTASNVVVTYSWSGLGFAGQPRTAGVLLQAPDVAPLTTVSLRNVQFAPFTSFVFGGAINLPQFAYTLPMEDGSGTSSN